VGSSPAEDVVIADGVSVRRKDGLWVFKLGSGCARLRGREQRVVNWEIRAKVDF
jgi:hypothetical protein